MVRSVMAVLALIIFPGLMAGQEPVEQAPARATLEEVVRFDFDEATLTAEAEQLLRTKLPIMRDSVAFRLLLEGHADERGSIEYNLALGGRRAESVRDFLMGLGISADRLTTTSFGEERPLVNRSDADVAFSGDGSTEEVVGSLRVVLTEEETSSAEIVTVEGPVFQVGTTVYLDRKMR